MTEKSKDNGSSSWRSVGVVVTQAPKAKGVGRTPPLVRKRGKGRARGEDGEEKKKAIKLLP